MRHRVSAFVVALIIAGSPVAAMVCQFTCVAATAADPHACCHDAKEAPGGAITCASVACDHADEAVTTPAVITELVIAGADASTSNFQLPTPNATASKTSSWTLEVGVWKLSATPSSTSQLRI